MTFVLYLLGYLLIGVVYGISQIEGLPSWVPMGVALVLAGVGLIAALNRSKSSDMADAQTDRLRHVPPHTPPTHTPRV